jgi:hypothetical protein
MLLLGICKNILKNAHHLFKDSIYKHHFGEIPILPFVRFSVAVNTLCLQRNKENALLNEKTSLLNQKHL